MSHVTLIKTTLILTLLSLSTHSFAGQKYDHRDDSYTDFARVIHATPQYERINTPKTVCRTEQITERRHSRSESEPHQQSYAGAVIGGVAGALLGKQVGQGNGKQAAIAAGTLAGAIIGNNVQNQRHDNYREARYSPSTTTVERCEQRDNWEESLIGYQVTYEYAGRRYTSFMQERPNRRIPIEVSVSLAKDNSGKHHRGWRRD